MRRSGRDALFALAGGLLLLGGLAMVVRIGGGGEEPTSAATGAFTVGDSEAGDSSDSTMAVSESGPDTPPTTTTTTAATTTTTLPAEPESITIVSIESSEPELWEDAEACAALPRTAQVTATIIGPEEIVGAALGWAVDGPEFDMEWVDMVEVDPGVYSVEVGPFDEESVVSGSAEAILLAVESADVSDEGAYDDSSLVLLLHDCGVGT